MGMHPLVARRGPGRRPAVIAALTAASLVLAALAGAPSAMAVEASAIEGTWAYQGGRVSVEPSGPGTYRGRVTASTRFLTCDHPVGEIMWDIAQNGDGTFSGTANQAVLAAQAGRTSSRCRSGDPTLPPPMDRSTARKPRRTIGLDVDGDFVAAVEVADGSVTRAVSGELETGLVSGGEIADPDGLGKALGRFFKDQGLSRNVMLGLANQEIVVRQLEVPPIENEEERAAAIRFLAEEAIAIPLDEAVLDYQSLGQGMTAEGAATERWVVVAARRAMVDKLVHAAKAAQLKPEGIDLSAFALVRALAEPSVNDEHARVFCHLGGVANLAIAVGSTCLFTRLLSSASVVPRDDVPALVAALAEEIRLSIDFYMDQPHARWVGDVVLSGPRARQEGLSEQLSELVGLAVSVAEPLGRLSANGAVDGEDPHRHTIAVGLALGATA